MLRLMVVKRLAVALALFPLFSACGDTGAPDLTPVSASASPTSDATPVVSENGSRTGPVDAAGASASCVETYSGTTIGNRDFAFDGTVVAIGPGETNKSGRGGLDTAAVSFRVNEWFKGGTDDTVTIDMGTSTSSAEDQTPAYEEGTRLLVSGEPRWGGAPLDDALAWSCGFTRYYEPAVADAWRRGTA